MNSRDRRIDRAQHSKSNAKALVQFPPRFHALYFGRDLVAGMTVEEFDVETPAVYRYPVALTER